jgi:hypothetical protein
MIQIHFKFARRWMCCATLSILAAGCHVLPPMPNTVKDMGPRYRPSNVYRRANALPPEVRRVALLPLVTTEPTGFLKDGVDALGPLVDPELEKCKRFEIVPVSREDLRQWTGRTGWRTDEPLPADFFARISEATGCDAVLFCQLIRYAPYQPVAVGWKFSLVATPETGPTSTLKMRDKIIWAADEVLDAGEPGVANAARDYYSQHLNNEAASADATTILSSPVMFGRYTMAALFETLPARTLPTGKSAKADGDKRR